MMNRLMRRFYLPILLLLSCLVLVAPVIAENENDPITNTDTLIAFHKAEATRDYEAMRDLIAEDFVRHSVATSAIAPDVEITNREQYIAFLQDTAAGFPDYVTTPLMLIEEDDYVAFFSQFKGTFVANGNRVLMPVAGVVRFENGLMAEMWVEWDNVSWDMQMNAVETPATCSKDLVGVWEIVVGDHPYRLEFTADGNVLVGYSAERPQAIASGTYFVRDGQLHDINKNYDCEGIYNVFVKRLSNGQLQSIRFELVGEDCYYNRWEAFAGKTVYPFNDNP